MYNEYLQQFGLRENQDVVIVPFGSRVYGTQRGNSDYDFIAVMAPHILMPLDGKYLTEDCTWEKGQITIHQDDYETFVESMTRYSHIESLEAYFHPSGKIRDKFWFTPNLPRLRKSISQKASNSFVKAKKKILQGDYLLGYKSLFHSLRILAFGIQIAQSGEIYNFSVANRYFWRIMEIQSKTWEPLKKEFKPIYNELATEFRKLAPKD